MQNLLQDLLAYSQVVHERAQTPHSLHCLTTLVEEAQQVLQGDLETKGGEIVCGSLPCLRVSPTEISAVFQNLLSNAIKYAQPGVRPVIQITAEEKGAEYLVCVRDNGMGFEQIYSEVVFQLFQRLHNNHDIPGTGLGLAICRRIIEKHGGRMWAESLPQAGSSFFFTLPKALEEDAV